MYLAHCLIVLWFSLADLPQQSTAAQSQAQPPAPSPSQQKPAPQVDPQDLPVSLDRIQRALSHTPMLRFDQNARPVFRVQVFGDKPTIEDILGPDFAKGPVPYGGMTHQEFLNLVTPKEFQGYAGYTNEEGMQLAASSFLLQWTLQKALKKFNETRDERAREAARKEVLDALNALEKARAKAGLPPK
jgi:hypothetical protein